MSVRRLFAAVASTSLVAASLALATPAQADPTFVPVEADIVGVGSDTTMYALSYLADGHNGVPGFNEGKSTGRLVSFDANILNSAGVQTNSTTVVLKAGAAPVTRPNGSGNGKKTLYGAGNLPDVDFARSSSSLSADETNAGLFQFPFAKDTMALATAKTTNAPASLTGAQMLQIFKGEVTNWSEVGGTPGVIEVLLPQAGSGTFSFFDGELKKLNGGAAVVYAPTHVRVQEHDPAPLAGNPNAIAPFSIGRNRVAGEPLKIAGGWQAARAVYNVLRQADVSRPDLQAVFGASGFICSPLAYQLIADAGFDQLAGQAKGGVCGVATQAATTNFTLASAEALATSTTLTGSSSAAGSLTATAAVGAVQGTPYGLVQFYLDGASAPAATVPLTAGKAVRTFTGQTAGAHTVVAKYVPAANSAFGASTSVATQVTVLGGAGGPVAKVKAKLKENFPAKLKTGEKVTGEVTVKADAQAVGKVVVKLGKKTVATGTLKAGKAKVTLKASKLEKGKNKLTIVFEGTPEIEGATKKFTVKLV